MTDLRASPAGSGPWGIRSSLRDHISLGAPDRSRVTVAVSPLATVGLLTFDAVQRRSQLGTPAALRRAVRARLDAHDHEILRVLIRDAAPACLVGESFAPPASIASIVCGSPIAGREFDDALDALIACAPEIVVASLGADASVHTDPAHWLRHYATALRHVWSGVEPLWRRARVLLDHEIDRMNAAAGRGRFADLIAAATSTAGIAWRACTMSSASRITVCPTLAGRRATVLATDERGVTTALFYPAPDAGRALTGRLPPSAALEALVGHLHALVLQQLDGPCTLERLAESLDLRLAVAEHEIEDLERAGLVAYAHDDIDVVERTARGTLLLSLYDRD